MTDENIEVIEEKVIDEDWVKEHQTNLKLGETLDPSLISLDDSWKEKIPKTWGTLYANEMSITRYQPIALRHFVFCLDGVDAFLVRKVERPSFVRKAGFFGKKKQHLVVWLHEAVSPSASQQVKELQQKNGKVTAKLKMLDPIGTVIGLIVWKGIRVERVDYSTFNYDDKGLASIKVTLSFDNEEQEF